MTTDVKILDPVADTVRAGARDASAVWWWFLPLGALWIWFGAFVLSYRVEGLAAVAAFAGVAFLGGGITQLVAASRGPTMRWLSILGGVLGIAAGIVTLAWPGITLYVLSILVAWYLIAFGVVHLVSALAGPKLSVVVDRAAAGHRRAGPGRVGGAFMGAVAGDPAHPGRSVGHLPRGQRDLRRLHPAPGSQGGGAAGRLNATRQSPGQPWLAWTLAAFATDEISAGRRTAARPGRRISSAGDRSAGRATAESRSGEPPEG